MSFDVCFQESIYILNLKIKVNLDSVYVKFYS